MNKRQTKRYRMFLTTQDTMNNHSEIWNGTEVIAIAKGELDEEIEAIGEKNEDTMASGEGLTTNKKAALQTVIQTVLIVSSNLQAYASSIGDQGMAETVKLTRTNIQSARETDVEGLVTPVLTLARNMLLNMVGYDLTEQMIDDAEAAVSNYTELVGQARTILNQANAAKEQLGELIDATSKLLKSKLDMLMVRYEYTHPEFYSEYKRARTIID